ncbi:nucleic-acid-binding protein from transposon X-element [Trichonephila clavipes]|nr:nucleic-acid-binding protein from transposon X-element [Trichonephila clavipes]
MQKFPNVKSKSSGKHLKLNTDCHDEYKELTDFMDEDRDIEFYVIKPKESRPIKVVVKGLPGCTKPSEIILDLENQGYTVISCSQLISKRTKLELPFFLITMPRNEQNLTVFYVTHLGFMQVKIECYCVHGTTQCFNCHNFFHTAANCHMITRCLKCGKEHPTKECDIKERQENSYCINCNAYGHTACYSKCPNFPKPKKGSPLLNRNSKKFTSNNGSKEFLRQHGFWKQKSQ